MYGTLTVITGPMSCGKTEELIRRLRRAEIAQQRVILFKPKIDTRNPENHIYSRSGLGFEAVTIASPKEILKYLDQVDASGNGKIIQVIGIDEAHFCDKDELSQVIKILLRSGKKIIVSGLDQDFLGEPFDTIATLMALADKVLKLSAICLKCGGDATMSQKLINGQPARRNSARIECGGDEKYIAVCRDCHTIPD